MKKWVEKKDSGDTAAPRRPDANNFKMPLPPARLGTHGGYGKSQRPGATTPAQSDDVQEPDHAHRYGSELGSTGDTTTNLTQDFQRIQQESTQHPTPGNREPFQPFQPSSRLVEGEEEEEEEDDEENEEDDEFDPPSEGEDSDLDLHLLTYVHNGMEKTVSRSQEPEEYARIHAILNQQRLEEQTAAELDAQSYPTTTTGEPSIGPEHYEQNQHPEQYGLDSLPVRSHSQPIQNDSHQMAPPQYIPDKATQPIHQDQEMRPPTIPHQDQKMRRSAMPHPKGAYADLAKHQHHAPPVDQTRQRHNVPTNLNGAKPTKIHSPPQANATNIQPARPITAAGQSQTEFEPGLLTPTKAPKQKQQYYHRDARAQPLEDVQPDYDKNALKQKTFADLQNEHYDVDPRTQSKGHRKLKEDELHKKLQELLNKDRPQQKKLLHSLDVAQWDQAGDWFLDQFATIFEKFKKQRSERRSLSRSFEEQIAERHEVVSKKRKITEDELNGMKVSGRNVLDTPKKMRKHL